MNDEISNEDFKESLYDLDLKVFERYLDTLFNCTVYNAYIFLR